MDKPSKLELNYIFNTLVCVVKALEGEYTVIDLRGECCVVGKIVYVDGFMNVDMEDCVYYNARGDKYPFNSFFVKKRNIRYVHIPEGLSAVELAQNHFDTRRNARRNQREKPKGKSLFRKKRSEKYQREILEEIATSSK